MIEDTNQLIKELDDFIKATDDRLKALEREDWEYIEYAKAGGTLDFWKWKKFKDTPEEIKHTVTRKRNVSYQVCEDDE